ncbi:tetratricopeptide repeat protein, partial [Thermodesulfobacteriota bacterium]
NKVATALMDLAWFYTGWAGAMELEKGTKCMDEALEIIMETGDAAGEVQWLMTSGQMKSAGLGKLDDGEADLQRALDACRQFGDKRGMLLGLLNLSLLLNWKGDLELVRQQANESTELLEELGYQHLRAPLVGILLSNIGEYDEAFKLTQENVKIVAEIGVRRYIAMAPNCFGYIYNQLCNFETGIEHDRNGVIVSQRYNEPECEIFSLLNLAGNYIGLREYDKAMEYLDGVKQKRELERYGERRWRYDMHMTRYLSEVWLGRGDCDKAMGFAEQTLTPAQNTGSKKYIGFGWQLKGQALMAVDRYEEAIECLEKARELADKMGYPPLRWKTRYLLGQVHKAQGRIGQAKEELQNAAAVIEKMASKVSDKEVKETFLSSEPVRDVYTELRAL